MTSPRQWTLRLAYPKIPLSLNDRRHHMVVARERSNLRNRVRVLARQHQMPRLEQLHVQLHWIPATSRTRDPDNLVPTLKSAIDGLRDYAPRNKRLPDGGTTLADPGWTGVIADDDPKHVTWSMPVIEPPDKTVAERLVLVITEGDSP